MSQDALARAVGTSQRNIVRWEGGHHRPGAGFLAAIARATGQPLEFFYSDDPEEEESMASAMHKAAAAFSVIADRMDRVA